jgi:CBS domain-containing protein
MTASRDNSKEFLSIYNEIDEYMRRRLNVDDRVPHKHMIDILIKKDKVFNRYKDDLFDFARLRNAIVHNPYEADADPIAEPHDFIVEKYRKIKNEILNPVRLIDIAVRDKNIYSASLDDNALDVMKRMNEYSYTHAPVQRDGLLIGVFSLYSVFAYLTENEGRQIIDQTKVRAGDDDDHDDSFGGRSRPSRRSHSHARPLQLQPDARDSRGERRLQHQLSRHPCVHLRGAADRRGGG